MTVAARAIHLERLLSRRVVDPSGKTAGRLEEARATEHGDELRVYEYEMGPDALLQRLAVGLSRFRIVRALGIGRHHHGRRVPWDKLDLSDPHHPRLTCPASELESM